MNGNKPFLKGLLPEAASLKEEKPRTPHNSLEQGQTGETTLPAFTLYGKGTGIKRAPHTVVRAAVLDLKLKHHQHRFEASLGSVDINSKPTSKRKLQE